MPMPNPLRTMTDTQLAERLTAEADWYRQDSIDDIEDRAEQVALADEAARRLRVLAGLREWLGHQKVLAQQDEDFATARFGLGNDSARACFARKQGLAEAIAELDRRLAEG